MEPIGTGAPLRVSTWTVLEWKGSPRRGSRSGYATQLARQTRPAALAHVVEDLVRVIPVVAVRGAEGDDAVGARDERVPVVGLVSDGGS